MNTEQIQRSEDTKTRASNTMVVLTADEGKKLINQDYLDYKNGTWEGEDTPTLIICSKLYLGAEDSALNYAEIDEATALQYQEEWDKLQEEMLNIEIPSETL